ncbi:hypothetical protein DXG01_014661 [Tephrocybe rancida]|nr:hypothetical protein DXG01_014661 [Tephrocybe rancida]
MAECITWSRKPAQPTMTQVTTRKTHSAKATVEPVDDPPAKSSCRKPLPKPVEDDEGDNDAVAANKTPSEVPQAPKKTAQPVPCKKAAQIAQVAQDAFPYEDDTFTSNRCWGRNAPTSPPLMQDPRTETPPLPRTETSLSHPAQAPSPHAETPPPPSMQGLPICAGTPSHPLTQGLPTHSGTPPFKTPESKPKDPNHYRDKGFTPSSSDFGETEAARQFRCDHMLPYRRTPDMEEQDSDDLEAFKWEILTGGGTKSKGKEKEGTTTPPHKSGPIPNNAKEEAFALQATFRNDIEALAARIRKSPDTLYAFIGKGAKMSRCTVSLLGVFEAWYASEGNFKKPKTTSAQDWAVIMAGEYQEYCKQELNKRFIMNLHPDETGHTGSMMWGVTRAYELMKKKQKKIILEEMAEWESLLRVSDIELRGTSAIDDPSLMFVAKLKKHTNIRDDEQSLFIEWLRLDIGRALFKHGWEIDVCLAMKMSWTDWPNFAYTHKLCLINWPIGAVPPGQTDEKYNIKKKSNRVSQQCLKTATPSEGRILRVMMHYVSESSRGMLV